MEVLHHTRHDTGIDRVGGRPRRPAARVADIVTSARAAHTTETTRPDRRASARADEAHRGAREHRARSGGRRGGARGRARGRHDLRRRHRRVRARARGAPAPARRAPHGAAAAHRQRDRSRPAGGWRSSPAREWSRCSPASDRRTSSRADGLGAGRRSVSRRCGAASPMGDAHQQTGRPRARSTTRCRTSREQTRRPRRAPADRHASGHGSAKITNRIARTTPTPLRSELPPDPRVSSDDRAPACGGSRTAPTPRAGARAGRAIVAPISDARDRDDRGERRGDRELRSAVIGCHEGLPVLRRGT